MQSIDFILEGKSYRAWPQSGQGQVAPGARVAMPRLYDAEQFVQKLQHTNPEQIAPLCALAGLFQSNAEDLAQALHKGQLIIGLGVQSSSRAMGDAQAAEQWRKKQAAPLPLYGAVMQQFFDSLPASGASSGSSAAGVGVLASTPLLAPAGGVGRSSSDTSSKPPITQTWECLIEVAGRKHFPTQTLALVRQPDRRYPVNIDRSQPHRSLIAIPVPDNQPVSLVITISAQGGPPIQLPLPQPVQPRQKGPPPSGELDNLLIPVRPVLYRNLQSDPQRAKLPQDGYLYLFWKGRLWRELAVDSKGVPRDIDVRWERNQRTFVTGGDAGQPRKATGHNLDAIWVPAKLGGTWQTGDDGFELAFFPHQLTWREIDQFENDATQRRRYTTALDSLKQYAASQDFGHFDACTGPLRGAIPPLAGDDDPFVREQNQQHQILKPYRGNNFAAAYVRPTTKRIKINLRDAYNAGLLKRLPGHGETLLLKGRKEYSVIVSGQGIHCLIDVEETRLQLELKDCDHPQATERS